MFVFKDALLDFIGVQAISNRDALMEELDALPDTAFEKAMNSVDIADKLSHMMCADCKADHGGKCINDGECKRRLSDGWLSEPCRHEQLIDFSEVLT